MADAAPGPIGWWLHVHRSPLTKHLSMCVLVQYATENADGEEETEILPGLRIWVTTLRGGRPHTQLIDLQGAILGAFELPILADAVMW